MLFCSMQTLCKRIFKKHLCKPEDSLVSTEKSGIFMLLQQLYLHWKSHPSQPVAPITVCNAFSHTKTPVFPFTTISQNQFLLSSVVVLTSDTRAESAPGCLQLFSFLIPLLILLSCFMLLLLFPWTKEAGLSITMHNRYGVIINSPFYTSQLHSNEKYPLKKKTQKWLLPGLKSKRRREGKKIAHMGFN